MPDDEFSLIRLGLLNSHEADLPGKPHRVPTGDPENCLNALGITVLQSGGVMLHQCTVLAHSKVIWTC